LDNSPKKIEGPNQKKDWRRRERRKVKAKLYLLPCWFKTGFRTIVRLLWYKITLTRWTE